MSENFRQKSLDAIPKNYKIIKLIGSGGMADIYLANDQLRNRQVAIKILKDASQNKKVNKFRFKEEVRLAKFINSKYVIKFIEGKYNNDVQYLVMEYVNGKILQKIIEERIRLSIEQTVDYSYQLACGFSEIHKLGIIHRDIKSSNIMISNDTNEVKIIDFGIALNDDSIRYTQTGKIIGSVHYIAPEIINRENPSEKSEIYALGIMMYEMLAGKTPHRGNSPLDTVLKHQSEEIRRIHEIRQNVPMALSNIIAKATAKDKNLRYENMAEMAEDIKTCLNKDRENERELNLQVKKEKTGLFSKLFGGRKK